MNKIRKTIIVILCILLMAVLILGGCSSRNREKDEGDSSHLSDISAAEQNGTNSVGTSDSADANASATVETGVDPGLAANNPVEPKTPPSTSGGETASFVGTIVDAGMGQFLVELDNGVSLTVDYTNADISKLTDSLPGNKVKVTYTGIIDGADTSGMTVISIEQA